MRRFQPLLRLSRASLSRPAVASRPILRPFSVTRLAATTIKPTGSPETDGPELEVGELEGGTFRIEPLRRTGEDVSTMRSRLQYMSRKRGILETDLLLSTFADEHLAKFDYETLTKYDLFLDENDWDIYYWATQDPPSESSEVVEKVAGADMSNTLEESSSESKSEHTVDTSGEWAQTVGKFKPAYRPVPSRWQDSVILQMLRDHVAQRAAAAPKADAAEATPAVREDHKGGGLGQMPKVKTY